MLRRVRRSNFLMALNNIKKLIKELCGKNNFVSGTNAKKFEPYKVGSGSEGIVYRISDSLVAKVPYYQYRIGDLDHEYRMCLELNLVGVAVPRPEGVFEVDIPGGSPSAALVMEFIEGQKLARIKSGRIKTIALKSMEEEITKARDYSFITRDCGVHNSIFVAKEEQTYLIDFSGWLRT